MASPAQTVALRRTGVRLLLRTLVLAYLTFLLVIPVVLVLWKTFEDGLGTVFDSLTTASTLHAIQITVVVAFW